MLENEQVGGKKKIITEISYGLVGIFFGVLVIAVIFVVLSYFKVINLFPKPQNLTTTTTISKSIRNRDIMTPLVEKAGYEITLIISPNGKYEDFSGRSILASEKRVVDGWTDQFGWQKSKDGKYSRGLTSFIEWRSIPGSKDSYLVGRELPLGKRLEVKIAYNTSIIEVDNLNYGPLNQKITAIEKLSSFNMISREILDKIIKNGDVVAVVVEGDQSNTSVVKSIQIRRFGGKEAINRELGK